MRVVVDPEPVVLEAAFQLRQRVFIEEQGVPAELERDELDAVAHHVVLLAGDGARAIGTGRVRLVNPGVAKVERVAVAADQRGLGVGRRVMAALEDRARALGATSVRLAAQESAIPFYLRLDYTAHGERFWDAGLPHRWMDKPLV